MKHPAVQIVLIMGVVALLMLVKPCEAQDKVAYCKNAQTGEVIVIEANYACPMGFYRI